MKSMIIALIAASGGIYFLLQSSILREILGRDSSRKLKKYSIL